MSIAEKISQKIQLLRGNQSLRDFGEKCEISHTTIDNLEKKIDPRTGKTPQVKVETLEKIANANGVPITYFFEETTSQTIHDNHGVIGDTHAPVTINNGSVPGEIEKELLNICSQLDMKRKNALLAKAYELLDSK